MIVAIVLRLSAMAPISCLNWSHQLSARESWLALLIFAAAVAPAVSRSLAAWPRRRWASLMAARADDCARW